MSFLQTGLRLTAFLIFKHASEHKGSVKLLVTFDTANNQVGVPLYLKAKHPEKMVIMIYKDYEDFEVNADGFSIVLFFSGKEETITVPFNMIYKIEDPDEGFILDYHVEKEPEDNIIKINFKKPDSIS
jgi:hypothetical protein